MIDIGTLVRVLGQEEVGTVVRVFQGDKWVKVEFVAETRWIHADDLEEV